MTDQERAIARLHTTFELFESGLRMKEQTLRRQFPQASDEEIQAQLNAWLEERPGAEFGDAEGIPGTWPRTRAPSNGS